LPTACSKVWSKTKFIHWLGLKLTMHQHKARLLNTWAKFEHAIEQNPMPHGRQLNIGLHGRQPDKKLM